MPQLLLRLVAEVGPGISWVSIFLAAVTAVFTFYVGFAMLATFRAHDSEQARIRYQVFSDLLALFSRRRSR